ncbi:hypothetical protein R3P38DRAFT_3212769 [Favolaschia claudopus]|uniref:Uncharacterized protein n=1 Tax=Favolaschia claudopus TaxID=2862362 RepID=A0AAW0ADW3_9AGAR
MIASTTQRLTHRGVLRVTRVSLSIWIGRIVFVDDFLHGRRRRGKKLATRRHRRRHPRPTNPPKPNTRTAASTASLLLNRTRDELLRPSDIPWDNTDTSDVIRHLASKGFIPAENGRSISLPYLEDIAMILLRIGADASSVVTKNACRAVARLLEWWKRDEIIEDLADDVKKLLGTSAELKEHFSSVREDLETAAGMLARTVEQQRAEMSTLTARVEEDLSQLTQQA